MRTLLITARMMTAVVSAASAAPGTTVNSFTPAQNAKARKTIIEARYKPDVLEFAQASNLFYTATKKGDTRLGGAIREFPPGSNGRAGHTGRGMLLL